MKNVIKVMGITLKYEVTHKTFRGERIEFSNGDSLVITAPEDRSLESAKIEAIIKYIFKFCS